MLPDDLDAAVRAGPWAVDLGRLLDRLNMLLKRGDPARGVGIDAESVAQQPEGLATGILGPPAGRLASRTVGGSPMTAPLGLPPEQMWLAIEAVDMRLGTLHEVVGDDLIYRRTAPTFAE